MLVVGEWVLWFGLAGGRAGGARKRRSGSFPTDPLRRDFRALVHEDRVGLRQRVWYTVQRLYEVT